MHSHTNIENTVKNNEQKPTLFSPSRIRKMKTTNQATSSFTIDESGKNTKLDVEEVDKETIKELIFGL